jgi:hypothetical protein
MAFLVFFGFKQDCLDCMCFKMNTSVRNTKTTCYLT